MKCPMILLYDSLRAISAFHVRSSTKPVDPGSAGGPIEAYLRVHFKKPFLLTRSQIYFLAFFED